MSSTSDDRSRPRTEIDTTVPHEARVYNYWLGGKDNYEADRVFGDTVAQHIPTIKAMAQANRAFLGRAVRYLVAEAGVTQFLDIGTGIPSADNTHEVAQQIDPSSRIVYVDKDPLVLAHARALMSSTPEGATTYIQADLHEPRSILEHPAVAETLDLDRPVAIMLVAIMMYFHDSDRPAEAIQTLLDAVPSGSFLTITHPTGDFAPAAMARAVTAIEAGGVRFQARSRAEFETLFNGLPTVEPGLVPVAAWRLDLADGPSLVNNPEEVWYWSGVARKP
ncbi:SAM-dependent methyltransferase [Skermania piniformis]|uniref:SAM-dependent methyltransferase n=1 Tax=Skermania pinensis TaxID=39122 RepID=UPI00083198EB|nr:SAM-dependent methyltransferase [Skermania piniformis]